MRLIVRIITLISAFVLAMLLVLKFWVLPGIYNTQNQARTLLVAQAVIQFQKDHGSFSEVDGELPPLKEIVDILKGRNSSGKNYLGKFDDKEFKDGEILDFYGRPYRFQRGDDGIVSVISSGRNGTFGDEDDVSDQSEVKGE